MECTYLPAFLRRKESATVERRRRRSGLASDRAPRQPSDDDRREHWSFCV